MSSPHKALLAARRRRGHREPLAFLAGCLACAAAGAGATQAALSFPAYHFLAQRGFGGWSIAFLFSLTAPIVLFWLAAWVCVLSLAANALGPARRGFEPTVRIVAVAWAPLALAGIPWAMWGAIPYAVYLLVRGLVVVHGLGILAALGAVLVSTLVLWPLHQVLAVPYLGPILSIAIVLGVFGTAVVLAYRTLLGNLIEVSRDRPRLDPRLVAPVPRDRRTPDPDDC